MQQNKTKQKQAWHNIGFKTRFLHFKQIFNSILIKHLTHNKAGASMSRSFTQPLYHTYSKTLSLSFILLCRGFFFCSLQSTTAEFHQTIRNIGTSFRVTICELYIICDHVQSLFLAKANLLLAKTLLPICTLITSKIIHLAVK